MFNVKALKIKTRINTPLQFVFQRNILARPIACIKRETVKIDTSLRSYAVHSFQLLVGSDKVDLSPLPVLLLITNNLRS